MELYIYNPSIELIGVIDLYSSLRWRRRFFEPGEFELYVPATTENLALLADGNIVHRIDREEAGIIEEIEITTTENGDEITATGRMGSSMLEQRIITPAINFCGAVEVGMRKIVSDNAITARHISLLGLGTLNGYLPECSFQASYKSVMAVLVALGRSAPLGFRVRLDIQNKAWLFETYQGTDRSVLQTVNPYVVFTKEFLNITNPRYTLNSQAFKNYAIVAGEGVGAARIIVEVDQTDGADRRELFVDAKDLTQGDLTIDQYHDLLLQRGFEKLAETMKAESFSADAINTENFEYLKDWNLGDIVSFEKWGLLLNQRITEVEEVFENGYMTVTPICGTPLPETLKIGDEI